MLDHLTAKNFISTLSTDQVNRLFNESIYTQNIVAFSVTFKELVRRKKLNLIIDDFVLAFENNFKFEYKSTFANTLLDVCYEYRKYIPFFVGIHMNLENNLNDNGFFDVNIFEKIYRSGCDNYYGMFTATDVVTMDPAIWTAILNYETDRIRRVELIDREEALERAKQSIRGHFERQVLAIIRNEDLILGMSPRTRFELRIDERIEELKQFKRCASAIEEEDEEN